MEDIVLPVIIFGSITAIVLLPIYWRAEMRRRVLETVKDMANTGTPLSSDLVLSLMGPIQPARPSREADLRRGFLLLALAAAIAIIGAVIYAMSRSGGDSESVGAGIAAFGAIPGCIGVAFILLGLMQKDRT